MRLRLGQHSSERIPSKSTRQAGRVSETACCNPTMETCKKEEPSVKKKVLALVLAMVLVVVGVAAGTLAWLTATSDTVTNTFTTSDIKVELTETNETYKMIPGYDIHKDPKATVLAGSEECFLFVKLEKSTNFDDFMTYEMADGWTLVEGQTNVYSRKVVTAGIGTAYSVLKGDKVTVKGTVTKGMMNAIDTGAAAKPTLTITAYASQLHKTATIEFTAAEAWANVNPANP